MEQQQQHQRGHAVDGGSWSGVFCLRGEWDDLLGSLLLLAILHVPMVFFKLLCEVFVSIKF